MVKKIGQVIEKHPDKKIGSYVYFIGDDEEYLKANATMFGVKYMINHVALVVPRAFMFWTKRMRIHADAQVTVIIYQLIPGKIVKGNHAIGKGNLNQEAIDAIIADIESHVR